MDCSICLDSFEDSAFSLTCGHLVHKECIQDQIDTPTRIVICTKCGKMSSAVISNNSIRKVIFTSPTKKPQQTSGASLQRQLDTLSGELVSVQRHLTDATSQNSLLSDQLRAAKNKEEAAIREKYESVKRVSELENDLDAWKKYARGLKQKNAEQETELERLRLLLASMEKVARSDTRSSLGDGEGENNHKVKQEEDQEAVLEPLRRRATLDPAGGRLIPDVSKAVYVESRQSQESSQTNTRPIRIVNLQSKPKRSPVHAQPAPQSQRSHSSASPTNLNRQYKRGSEILWKGYGCPQRTAVLECTASDGYHNFTGKGTNGYAIRYRCMVPGCGVLVSESRR